MGRGKITSLALLTGYCLSALLAPAASAVSPFVKEFSYVYNPESVDAVTCLPNGGVITDSETISSQLPGLPLSTTAQMERLNIKEKANKSKALYMQAEKESGVPWAAIAALHYREADMKEDRSITNGAKITGSSYTNVDGVKVGSNRIEDAKTATDIFKRNASGVYGVTISKSSSAIELGNAFLAYNRGKMYKNWGKTYNESPYVMNGYTDKHINMTWIDADSYTSPSKGKKLNSLTGKKESRPGAMAVYTYLGGTAGGGGSADCADGSVVSGSIVETAKALAHETPVQGRQSRPWSSKSKPSFVEAVAKYNPTPAKYLGEAAYADCGVYVSTVMRASGTDPNYPPSGTSIQRDYFKKHPELYKINNSPTLSSLIPGDILHVVNGRDHHTTIYTGLIGESGGKKLMMADASQEQRVPSLRTSGDLNWMLGRSGVFSVTYIGGKAAPDAR